MVRYNMNKGSALLTALFIMTLVAIASTAISIQINRNIYRTRLLIASDELLLKSQYVYYWAMSELAKKVPSPREAGNSQILTWPSKLNQTDSPIRIEAQVFDLQSRYNLNNLRNKLEVNSFSRLLQEAAKIDRAKATKIAEYTHDWLSPYALDKGLTTIDAYYHSLNPPYNSAHLPLANVSEFRLIKDVTAKIYRTVNPVITTLPEIVPININTASNAVLATLNKGLITEAQIKKILNARGKKGFASLPEVNKVLSEANIKADAVTLESNYFLCVIKLYSNDLSLSVLVTLKREKNNKPSEKALVSIVNLEVNS